MLAPPSNRPPHHCRTGIPTTIGTTTVAALECAFSSREYPTLYSVGSYCRDIPDILPIPTPYLSLFPYLNARSIPCVKGQPTAAAGLRATIPSRPGVRPRHGRRSLP